MWKFSDAIVVEAGTVDLMVFKKCNRISSHARRGSELCATLTVAGLLTWAEEENERMGNSESSGPHSLEPVDVVLYSTEQSSKLAASSGT